MNPRDLIRIARQLASGAVGGNRGRPRQAELRRAVSAAYYALFHALAHCCANRLAGSGRAEASWIQTYRALEHRHARNQCNDQSAMSVFPAGIQDFGKIFVLMQRQRQQADYSASATLPGSGSCNSLRKRRSLLPPSRPPAAQSAAPSPSTCCSVGNEGDAGTVLASWAAFANLHLLCFS